MPLAQNYTFFSLIVTVISMNILKFPLLLNTDNLLIRYILIAVLLPILRLRSPTFFIWSENCLFKIFEELCWNFDSDCIKSIDYFGKMMIFFYCVNPMSIGDHSIIWYFLIYFFKVLLYKSFACLVSVTPKYLILFGAIVKGGVVSLIFFSIYR